MKLGNVSQTIIQVPKFFYDTSREIEAFKSHYRHLNTIRNERRHFSFSDQIILHTNLDININHNPRLIKNTEKFNQEIYIPFHQRFFTPNFKKSNNEIKIKRYNPKYKIIKKLLSYKKKMNINETLSPHLREELMNTTYNLIERINNMYLIIGIKNSKFSTFNFSFFFFFFIFFIQIIIFNFTQTIIFFFVTFFFVFN